MGFPYISGYKPRGNYQQMLREVVADYLRNDCVIHQLAAADASEICVPVPAVPDIPNVITEPPVLPRRAAEVGGFEHIRWLVQQKSLSRYRVETNGPGRQHVTYLHFHVVAAERLP